MSETIYISIDTKTKQAKKLVELLATFSFSKILSDPNIATKKAIHSARKGKVGKAASLDQLFSDLKK